MGSSRPSTRRRSKDAAGIGVADCNGLQTQSFTPVLLARMRSMRRTTWMAGTSPSHDVEVRLLVCHIPIPRFQCLRYKSLAPFRYAQDDR